MTAAAPFPPGCHDCPAWRRRTGTIGLCTAAAGQAAILRRPQGALTIASYLCPSHPRFAEAAVQHPAEAAS